MPCESLALSWVNASIQGVGPSRILGFQAEEALTPVRIPFMKSPMSGGWPRKRHCTISTPTPPADAARVVFTAVMLATCMQLYMQEVDPGLKPYLRMGPIRK